ncbi:hypothetical protein BDR07DRAFT_1383631 [Suillus spraguei]|nr:hypothetical protein BDR07DRAFT_1383631 [Suillus spraguei]
MYTEHQNPAQTTATASTSDPKGRGKQKEVNPSAREDMSGPEESMGDTESKYPFEQFPLPPEDKSRNAHVPNTIPSLDPPLMDFRYPPPPPLVNDRTRYTQMVADVHRNHTHVNTQLDRPQTDADEALVDVTLAEIELKAERDNMQELLNRMGSVTGKNVVRKMIRRVERSLKTAHEKPDNNYEEDRRDSSDYEDSSSSDEDEVDHQDPEEEDFGAMTARVRRARKTQKMNNITTAATMVLAKGLSFHRRAAALAVWTVLNSASMSLSVKAKPIFGTESSELPPADESPHSSPQVIGYQLNRPDWCQGDITDDEYSSGEEETSRKWTDLSPAHKSHKRHLEFKEDKENNSPEDSPRKKYKETPPLPLKDVKLFSIPTRCFFPPEDQPVDQEQHDDSDEENEVENSLTLEHGPVPPWPYLPQLNRLERDPYRIWIINYT